MLTLFKPTSKPDFGRTSMEVNSIQFIDQFSPCQVCHTIHVSTDILTLTIRLKRLAFKENDMSVIILFRNLLMDKHVKLP